MTTCTQDKNFIDAVINSRMLEDAIEWIRHEFPPEAVFPKPELEAWAVENGYVKSEDR